MSDYNETDKTPILLHPARRIALLRQGQDFFNDEKFFEAHEAWEELWHVEQGRDRTFVQGLIQVAGHFVHIKKGNWSGALSLADSALTKFNLPPAHRLYREIDLAPLIAALEYNLARINTRPLDGPPPPPESFMTPKLFEK